MDRDAELLQNDALKSESQDDSYLTLLSETGIDKSLEHANSSHGALEKSVSWWTLGVAMVGWYGSQAMDSIAAEESVSSAASEVAPGWVAPSVLAFPVVSYFLFTLYRNKVGTNSSLLSYNESNTLQFIPWINMTPIVYVFDDPFRLHNRTLKATRCESNPRRWTHTPSLQTGCSDSLPWESSATSFSSKQLG